LRSGEEAGYFVEYWEASFERGSVVFKLVENPKTGVLEGIWVVAESGRGGAGALLAAAVVAGGLVAIAALWAAYKRLRASAVLLGAALVAVVLVQSPVQQAPLLAAGVKTARDVLERGPLFVAATCAWLGFVAGAFQELAKWFVCRNKGVLEAAFVGAGFGFGEALLTAGLALLQQPLGTPATAIPPATALALAERGLVAMFHTGTAAWFAYCLRAGRCRSALLSIIAAHALADAFAALHQLAGGLSPLLASYVAVAAVAAYTVAKRRGDMSAEAKAPRGELN